ncbi:hypothetical protein BDW02DRAFT_276974 [Decorospora gaudefroyi]|uniref:Uncharacterized protein n=1 Tax=Decorospora gaudefroyi TaxID=184978 RepID=A0A6A5KSB3_9PLEO|nr:hypothetical protein BDW02DRAFT_276974 [Decorospora gaudefroyi]
MGSLPLVVSGRIASITRWSSRPVVNFCWSIGDRAWCLAPSCQRGSIAKFGYDTVQFGRECILLAHGIEADTLVTQHHLLLPIHLCFQSIALSNKLAHRLGNRIIPVVTNAAPLLRLTLFSHKLFPVDLLQHRAGKLLAIFQRSQILLLCLHLGFIAASSSTSRPSQQASASLSPNVPRRFTIQALIPLMLTSLLHPKRINQLLQFQFRCRSSTSDPSQSSLLSAQVYIVTAMLVHIALCTTRLIFAGLSICNLLCSLSVYVLARTCGAALMLERGDVCFLI